MHRTLLAIVVAALSACGSHASDHVGTVSNAAQEAWKDWCAKGRLEMETSEEGLPPDSPARANQNLLVMHCYRTGEEVDPMNEDGSLSFDSKTEQLIDLFVELRASTAPALLERVLVPSLDAEQQRALADLEAWARANQRGQHRWDSHALSLIIITYPPSGSSSESKWNVIAQTALMRNWH